MYNEALWERDYQLVQRSLQGDQSAWDTLYNSAYPKAMRQASKCNTEKIFSQADLEDIVDEAFWRCYRNRNNFHAISLFSTWVCGFVRYVALEHKRKQYRRLCREGTYSYTPPASRVDPLDRLILLERDFCLWLAYDSLDRIDRALIAWRVLGWRTFTEARSSTGLCRSEMIEHAEQAIALLRRRFLAAYHGSKSAFPEGVPVS